MRDEDRIDEQEAAERHELMDYVQHEKTWATFTNIVKWSIIQMSLIVLGLFCIIQAGVPLLGVLLIIAGLVAPLGWMLFAPKRLPS